MRDHAQEAQNSLKELELQLLELQGGAPAEAVTEPATTEPIAAEPETPSSSQPIETETQPEPEPVKDLEHWKAAAEKRRKELETGLNKANFEKNRFKEELEAERQKNAEIEALKAEILALKAHVAPPTSDITLDDPELEEAYPDVAKLIKKGLSKVQMSFEQREAQLRAQIAEQQKRVEEARGQEAAQAHFARVMAKHPDAGDFFSEERLAPAIQAWAETKAPFISSILSRPMDHADSDVAWVISEFKREAGYTEQHKPKGKPVTGDMAIKVGSPTTPAPASNPDTLTEQEVANFDTLWTKAMQMRDIGKRQAVLAELNRKYENTVNSQSHS